MSTENWSHTHGDGHCGLECVDEGRSSNGKTPPLQGGDEGSIPSRSTIDHIGQPMIPPMVPNAWSHIRALLYGTFWTMNFSTFIWGCVTERVWLIGLGLVGTTLWTNVLVNFLSE